MTISKLFVLLMGLCIFALGIIFMGVAAELLDNHGRWSSDTPMKDAIYTFGIGIVLGIGGVMNVLIATGSVIS